MESNFQMKSIQFQPHQLILRKTVTQERRSSSTEIQTMHRLSSPKLNPLRSQSHQSSQNRAEFKKQNHLPMRKAEDPNRRGRMRPKRTKRNEELALRSLHSNWTNLKRYSRFVFSHSLAYSHFFH